MSDFLTVAREGSVTVLSVDDGKANALSADLIESMASAVADAEADATTTAIVLVGRDGKFSGGFDLNVMRSGDIAAIINLVTDGGEFVHQLYSSSVPVIAACTGHAVAAGALTLLGCDVRVGMTGSYKIGLNESAIGMVLPKWAITIAQARLANQHLQRALPTAELGDAVRAAQVGYLDEAVDPTNVVGRAMEVANEMSGLDRSAYAGTAKLLRADTLATMRSQLDADRASVA